MNVELQERLKLTLRLNGWCTFDKAMALAQLVLDHRPDVIVEAGVYGARSLSAMAMAVQSIGHGHVWGFDPWSVDAALEGSTNEANDTWWKNLDLEQIYKTCLSHVRTLGLDSVMTIERKKDDEAIGQFADGSIGLFHHDACHSEESSTRVARMWSKKISVGGLYLLDDSNWPSQAKAVEMLKDGSLGTKWVSTHQMVGDPDKDGNPTCGGEWMRFERVD